MSESVDNPGRDEQVMHAALAWHAATSRGDCDWDAFTAWLEQDPAHQSAYADVALLEDRIERHRPALQQSSLGQVHSQPMIPAARRARPWLAAAMAASVLGVALVLGWNSLPFSAPDSQEYQTLAAAQPVALADGTRIVLAPGSHMVVGGRGQDHIQLEGAAYFDVPHVPSRELVIEVGGYAVRDIGTRFEVYGAGRNLKVAVAEGNVTVELPGGRDTRVSEGQQLIVSGAPAVAEYASIAAEDVAGWRSGRLVFRNEPLSLVAGQIGPHAGVTVEVDPAIADRRFSGVLAIGDGSQLVERLGEIMGLAVEPRGDAVQLSAVGTGK
jgi:transmembrane sensor